MRWKPYADNGTGSRQKDCGFLVMTQLLECGFFCALHLKLIRPFHYPKDIFFVVKFYLLTVSFVYSKSFLSHKKL